MLVSGYFIILIQIVHCYVRRSPGNRIPRPGINGIAERGSVRRIVFRRCELDDTSAGIVLQGVDIVRVRLDYGPVRKGDGGDPGIPGRLGFHDVGREETGYASGAATEEHSVLPLGGGV